MSKQVDIIHNEDLIREVEKYRAIWDANQEDYMNKERRTNAWINVITTFVPDYLEKTSPERHEIETAIRKRWKSLRTCYSREILKMKTLKGAAASRRRQYLHFDQLKFLEPFMKSTAAHSEEESDPVKNLDLKKTDADCATDVKARKKTTAKKRTQEDNLKKDSKLKAANRNSPITYEFGRETLQDNIAGEVPLKKASNKTICCRREDDADKMFLMSLVSELHKVPQCRKLELKSNILLTIAKAQQSLSQDSCSNVCIRCDDHQPRGRGLQQPRAVDSYTSDRKSRRTQEDEIDAHLTMAVPLENPSFVKVESEESCSFVDEKDFLADSEDGEEILPIC